MPLGYEVTIFEQYDKPGGLMRSNIPSFRLPEEVLEEETSMILDMGVDIRYNTRSPVCKLCWTTSSTPSSWASVRREVRSWTFQVATTNSSRTYLLASTGSSRSPSNTSARSGTRPHYRRWQHRHGLLSHLAPLGGRDIKVMARRPRKFFKASPWELDDAEEEGVEILVNYAPTRFVIEDDRLVGMEFDILEWDEGARHSTTVDTVVIPCDDVILAIGQENSFHGSSATSA